MRQIAFLGGLILVACSREPRIALGEAELLRGGAETGAAPMVALSPSGQRTVAWVSAPDGGRDGRLYVVTDGGPTSELRDSLGGIEPHGEAPPKIEYAPNGTLYALYAVGKVIPGRRFPFTTLRMAASRDGGRTWSKPQSVASDSTTGSRNFHALHASDDGSLYVAWLETGSNGKSGSYITRSTDGGTTWSTPVRIALGEACPCCRTAIATGRNGQVFVAWRNVTPANVRDIVVARSSDFGATWNAPILVHNDDFVIDGCPHAGPTMHADSTGRLHIAWWTGADGKAGVYYANSTDGGDTFSRALEISSGRLVRPSHVQLALDGMNVAVAWDDGRDSIPRVLLRLSRNAGETFTDAATVSAPDVAGMFPVILLADGRLTVAWSQHTREEHLVSGHGQPNMKDPNATMPLPTVGKQRVMLRSAKY
jgi:hypothetical protein